MSRIIQLPFSHKMEFADPANQTIKHYSFIVKTIALEMNFPLSVNPREQKISGIYKNVRESLESNDGLFLQKNMGITILARSVEIIEGRTKIAKINCGGTTDDLKDKENIYGVIKGGQTYKIIINSKADQELNTDQQFIRINIITGVKDRTQIQEIARAHNTSTSVKEISLADFMGEFEWMKKSLGNPLNEKIVWHENDTGITDATDIISLLHCLHPELYPNDVEDGDKKRQPTIAYSQKTATLKKYLDDNTTNHTFQKFHPILADILELKDFIQANAWEEYKTKNKGMAKAVFETPNKSFEFLKLDDVETKPKYILHKAALLPILASCRVLIKNGATYSWKLSDFLAVKEFCKKSLSEYISLILDDIGDRNPSAWGKDFSLWSLLHTKAELKYMKLSNSK